MLKLILPEEKYWASFQDGLEELKQFPTPYDTMGITSGLKYSNFADYKSDCEKNRLGVGLKEGYVASTRLWLIDDDKFVGVFDIRHALTEALKKEGGNVAYYIVPSARKKGFAVQGLKLCCKYASDVLALKEVLVTCKASNAASYKTMKKVMIEYGGVEANSVIIGEIEEKRVWIRTKPRDIKIRPLAVALIEKENKVLAIKGYDDIKKQEFFRLVGGGIEFGETGKETLKREFMEELGFEPKDIEYYTTVENIFEFNGKPGHEIILVYKAKLPKDIEDRKVFSIQEEMAKDKVAEFVAVEGNLIFPSGIF